MTQLILGCLREGLRGFQSKLTSIEATTHYSKHHLDTVGVDRSAPAACEGSHCVDFTQRCINMIQLGLQLPETSTKPLAELISKVLRLDAQVKSFQDCVRAAGVDSFNSKQWFADIGVAG